MKRVTFLFICLTYAQFTANLYADYQQQATTWLHTYIIDVEGKPRISNNDLQLIANLIYFSYYRSKITLDAQEIALKTLESVWQGWQNIAQTRRNPSVGLPYIIAPAQEQTLEQFWPLQHKHRIIGLTYACTAQALVNSNLLESSLSLAGVQQMRNAARNVIMTAMADTQEYLNILLDNMQKKGAIDPQKRSTIFDRIWSYLSELSVSSFTKADQLYNKVSKEGWHAFKIIQEASKHMWQVVEEARASFYLAHYKTIYSTLQHLNLDQSHMTIMFDQHGLILEENRTTLLPNPSLFS